MGVSRVLIQAEQKKTFDLEVSPENLGFSEMSGNLILERFHLRKRLKRVLVNQIRLNMDPKGIKWLKID